MGIIALLAIGLIVVTIVGYVIIVYNSLIRLKRDIKRAWKNIDVLLKQRHDELPKLIDACKEYMGYEKKVLKDITEKRAKVEKASSPKEQARADNELRGALSNLFAVAEDYPKLRATENFQKLQKRISSLEEQLADRREFYNEVVTTYNTRINQIPYNFIANLLGYKEKELFKVPEEERKDIKISAQFAE